MIVWENETGVRMYRLQQVVRTRASAGPVPLCASWLPGLCDSSDKVSLAWPPCPGGGCEDSLLLSWATEATAGVCGHKESLKCVPALATSASTGLCNQTRKRKKNKTHPHWKGKVNLSLQSNLSSQIYPILNHLVL